MKYETLLVLSVNNYFIHFNKDTRSSKELPLDNMGKLESKMHDISNKWKCIDILFKALSEKNLSQTANYLGYKKNPKNKQVFTLDQISSTYRRLHMGGFIPSPA